MIAKIIKKIWNEFIYGGHLLALGLVGIGALVGVILDVRVTWDFVVVVYAPTLAACLFGRYRSLKEDALTNPVRFKHLESKARKIPALIAILVMTMVLIVIDLHKYQVLFFALGLISLSFLYELFFKNLTAKIPGFKNYFSGMLFTLVGVLFFIYNNMEASVAFYLVLVFVFVMCFMATSYSDLKDIAVDGQKNLKTLAVVMGFDGLLAFQSVLSVLVGFFIIACVYYGYWPHFALALIFGVLYNFVVFKWTKEKNANLDYLVDVCSDAQFILWLIFVVIGRAVLS